MVVNELAVISGLSVAKTVAGWKLLAEKYNISKAEQVIMAKAFWTE
jgi:hypothetical protein